MTTLYAVFVLFCSISEAFSYRTVTVLSVCSSLNTFFKIFFPAPTATLTAPNGALDRSYIHLICQVTGDPQPSITWYKNGVVLTVRARAQKFPLPSGELLRLGRILKSRHEGDYTCKASNADGTATSQTTTIYIYRG